MSSTVATLSWLVPTGVGLAAVWSLATSAAARRRARSRLFGEGSAAGSRELALEPSVEPWGSWLERWLFVSGFRGSGAVTRFLVAEGVAILVGATISLLVVSSGVVKTGVDWLREIPGGVGGFLAPILAASGWIVFVGAAMLPIAHVRARRREIVQSVDRDLPMTLALLATLVESGHGLDAAIDRVLDAMEPGRPLADELRTFRSQSRAGVPRISCFRGLARRLDVVSVSTFVSALVHSEHVGGAVAESLRRQADEVWNRRREFAIQRAQTLPTKLAIPLVLCFLPGIFVYTFGPALAEFLRIAEGVVSGQR